MQGFRTALFKLNIWVQRAPKLSLELTLLYKLWYFWTPKPQAAAWSSLCAAFHLFKHIPSVHPIRCSQPKTEFPAQVQMLGQKFILKKFITWESIPCHKRNSNYEIICRINNLWDTQGQDWMGVWASWSSGRFSPWQEHWNKMVWKVFSHPGHSMILWSWVKLGALGALWMCEIQPRNHEKNVTF